MNHMTQDTLYAALEHIDNLTPQTKALVDMLLAQQDNFWAIDNLINSDLANGVNHIPKRNGINTTMLSIIKNLGLDYDPNRITHTEDEDYESPPTG